MGPLWTIRNLNMAAGFFPISILLVFFSGDCAPVNHQGTRALMDFQLKADHGIKRPCRSLSDPNKKEDGNNMPFNLEMQFVASDRRKMWRFLKPSRRRRLLEVTHTHNFPAAPIIVSPVEEIEFVDIPSMGSGAFPSIPKVDNVSEQPPEPEELSANDDSIFDQIESITQSEHFKKGMGKWIYIVVSLATIVILLVLCFMLFIHRRRHPNGVKSKSAWISGLSGQLQMAFVSGVPKLHREELEAACEDFSNIVQCYADFTIYKGTLSSGVEIAVVSSIISSSKEWSKRSESHFRRKVDTLSRVNHKNFVNLIGYCEENEPFMRAMVFEYAPNGTLSEHLHVKDFGHIDWGVRMRIIMGISYCLQYMHQELNPPVAHPHMQSSCICLTDDFAAKVVDMDIWKEFVPRKKNAVEEDTDVSLVTCSDPEKNVYEFGILLIEIISGKPSYSTTHGLILNWAGEYLTDRNNMANLVDPTLTDFKDNELYVVCDVIQDCVSLDPKKKPTMEQVSSKLRQGLMISPDNATPKLSPLWWAELEILAMEAT